MKYNFLPLVNKIVSVALDNSKTHDGNKKETYIGKVKQVFDDYIVLEYSKFEHTDKRISQIVVNRSFIVSIWVYDENKLKNGVI